MKLLIMIRNMLIVNVFLVLIVSVAAISLYNRIDSAAWLETGPPGVITGKMGEKVSAFRRIMSDVDSDLTYIRQSSSLQDIFRDTPSRARARMGPLPELHQGEGWRFSGLDDLSLDANKTGGPAFTDLEQLSASLIRAAHGSIAMTDDHTPHRLTIEEVRAGIQRISAETRKGASAIAGR